MLRISRWNLLTGIWLHSLTSACCSSLRLWHLAFLTASPRSLHKFSMGLRSGLCGGHSRQRMFWSDFHCLTTLALWHGAPSSWKMCWGNGRVPENIQIAILVKVAFQWSEKPFLCTALHPTQSQRHHQISLWVQHNCFCMLHGLFSSQTPDHHFEREWILTNHSKAQLTNQSKSNPHVPLWIVIFSCGGLLLTVVFSKPHVPQDQLL